MLVKIISYLILSIVFYASFYKISKILKEENTNHPTLIAMMVTVCVYGLIGGVLVSCLAGVNSEAKFLIEHPSYMVGTIVGDVLGLTFVGWIISSPFRYFYRRKAKIEK